MIVHRLTTLKKGNTIFQLEQERLVDQGSYSYLLENNLIFIRIAWEEDREKKP